MDNIKREQAKERMRRYRAKSVTNSVTSDSVTDLSVTHPAIVLAVTDPVKRDKLTRIYSELSKRRLSGEVRYGIWGPTFDVVGKILEVT